MFQIGNAGPRGIELPLKLRDARRQRLLASTRGLKIDSRLRARPRIENFRFTWSGFVALDGTKQLLERLFDLRRQRSKPLFDLPPGYLGVGAGPERRRAQASRHAIKRDEIRAPPHLSKMRADLFVVVETNCRLSQHMMKNRAMKAHGNGHCRMLDHR